MVDVYAIVGWWLEAVAELSDKSVLKMTVDA